ncbi:MAG: hypothetical protein LUE98_04830 [Tannerellaceae bacterium]|nr:hypothetical protein [Tannerellaceae bacterium]
MESFIGDYNEMFGGNYTTRDTVSFYNYYNNVAKRVKNREIDILLVVNMFLTYRPTLKERKPVAERILGKIQDFINTFIEGL